MSPMMAPKLATSLEALKKRGSVGMMYKTDNFTYEKIRLPNGKTKVVQ